MLQVSTLLENKISHTENVLCSKFFVVDRESLAEFVKRIRTRENDWSLMDVRKNSGLTIATSYISRIENGEVTNVGIDKLTALAKGLKQPVEVLLAYRRGVEPNQKSVLTEDFENLALTFNDLPPTKKEKAVLLVDMMKREMERLKNE